MSSGRLSRHWPLLVVALLATSAAAVAVTRPEIPDPRATGFPGLGNDSQPLEEAQPPTDGSDGTSEGSQEGPWYPPVGPPPAPGPGGPTAGGNSSQEAGTADPSDRSQERDPNASSSQDPGPRMVPAPPMRFGMGLWHLEMQREHGIQPDLGQAWAGAWNLHQGWGPIDRHLDTARETNITPVIQVFYWGNDISKRCLQHGCDGRGGMHLSEAGWAQLIDELGQRLDQKMDGREAIVVLEPEFNKGHIATYEPLDAMLADRADQMHQVYPNATVALGLGGWAPQFWDTWDRAMDASDVVSLQLMRGATQDSQSTYLSAPSTLVNHAGKAQELSGKPVMITDIALATWPEPGYRDEQAQVIEGLFGNMSELKAAGVEVVIYRAIVDEPSATTAEYYGEAETTWGLIDEDGTPKPALDAWVQGIQQERRDPADRPAG